MKFHVTMVTSVNGSQVQTSFALSVPYTFTPSPVSLNAVDTFQGSEDEVDNSCHGNENDGHEVLLYGSVTVSHG